MYVGYIRFDILKLISQEVFSAEGQQELYQKWEENEM
jgi:hypothetical protein